MTVGQVLGLQELQGRIVALDLFLLTNGASVEWRRPAPGDDVPMDVECFKVQLFVTIRLDGRAYSYWYASDVKEPSFGWYVWEKIGLFLAGPTRVEGFEDLDADDREDWLRLRAFLGQNLWDRCVELVKESRR